MIINVFSRKRRNNIYKRSCLPCGINYAHGNKCIKDHSQVSKKKLPESLHDHGYSTFYNSAHDVLKPGKVLLDEENMVVQVSDSGSQFFFLSLYIYMYSLT
jgi:hypothetical protein